LIQQVFQFIYEMEGKRVDKKVSRVMGLFEKSPLEFDETMIDTLMQR